MKDFWKTNTFKITIYAIFWFSLAGLSFWAGVEFIKGNLSFNHIAQKINSISFKSQEPQKITQEEKKEVQTVQAQTQSTEEQKPQETTQENPKEEDISFRASTWFSDYEAMRKNIQYYYEVHPFIYNMKGGLSNDGNLVSIWSKEKRKERVEEMRSLNPNVKIIPTIFRWENPKEKISENIGMNGRNDVRDKHIQVILEEIETYGYDGIDIDYEGMTCNKKEKFEEFIVLLSKELKKRGKLLSIAVHPKTPAAKPKLVHCRGLKKPVLQDFAENWRGPMTHDYKFLAKYADRIKIMAYELHPRKYHNPGPGPQAPNVWLKNIIEYATARVPSHKLYMAIPTYGYDWALNCKSKAKAVYYDTALKIQESKHKFYQPTDISHILSTHANAKTWHNLTKFAYIHENKVYEDPSLWYTSGGCDRVAFFMNRRAFEEKMNLLRRYNLAGFSFWQLLRNNDPGINEYLKLLMTGKLPPVEKVTFLNPHENQKKINHAKLEPNLQNEEPKQKQSESTKFEQPTEFKEEDSPPLLPPTSEE